MPEDLVAAHTGCEHELYRDVILARERAHAWTQLGDESEMDLLAMRDHVVGLEAELVNARRRADYHEGLAQKLYAELEVMRNRRAMKMATALARLAPVVARRPSA